MIGRSVSHNFLKKGGKLHFSSPNSLVLYRTDSIITLNDESWIEKDVTNDQEEKTSNFKNEDKFDKQNNKIASENMVTFEIINRK